MTGDFAPGHGRPSAVGSNTEVPDCGPWPGRRTRRREVGPVPAYDHEPPRRTGRGSGHRPGRRRRRPRRGPSLPHRRRLAAGRGHRPDAVVGTVYRSAQSPPDTGRVLPSRSTTVTWRAVRWPAAPSGAQMADMVYSWVPRVSMTRQTSPSVWMTVTPPPRTSALGFDVVRATDFGGGDRRSGWPRGTPGRCRRRASRRGGRRCRRRGDDWSRRRCRGRPRGRRSGRCDGRRLGTPAPHGRGRLLGFRRSTTATPTAIATMVIRATARRAGRATLGEHGSNTTIVLGANPAG